jgi:exopolysaccharide biosynthesis polyprenyl glycosylphosphotransferase
MPDNLTSAVASDFEYRIKDLGASTAWEYAMASVGTIGQYRESSVTERAQQNEMAHVPSAKDRLFPYRFFLAADLCLVWFSAGIAHLFLSARTSGTHSAWHQEFLKAVPLGFILLFSVLVVLFADSRGLYDFPWRRSSRGDLKLLADSVVCSAIIIGAGSFLGGSGATSAGGVALTVVLTWVLMAAWRTLVRSQSIPGLTEKRNVLIVGYGPTAHLLQHQLEQNAELGYVVKGFVCRRRGLRAINKAKEEADSQLLGTVDQLSDITRAHFIDEILISVPGDRHLVKEIAQRARAARVQVRVVPDLYDGLATEQPIEYLGQFPTLTLYQHATPTLPLTIKRLMDITLSGISLALLSPIFAAIAVLVKVDSKGKVFYRAVRVGKKGVTFSCYKFRTMVENADALKDSLAHLNERDGILFKIADDPRVTRIGRYLRKFSIDELPQLWNVLKGEMSLVGPRPPACGEYTQYALEHLRRLDVTPGLTGLWQVAARQDPSFQNYIELDKEYVNHWSLGMDFRILIRTFGVVLAGTGQ